jgi:two-component system chemotaxis response regulator CheY
VSSLQSLQVLVVDDNQHMRAITSTVLHSANIHKVHEATNGAEAFDILRQFPVDLAIVDYNMYPLDGVEFTRMVRTSAQSANIYLPIIMMSGHAEKSRVYAARDAGVTEFLVKPITAKAIIDRINAVIFKPRPFVKTETYFGPCRRRREIAGYAGPFRRVADARRASNAA